jgi:hypothetical protein
MHFEYIRQIYFDYEAGRIWAPLNLAYDFVREDEF